MINPFKKNYSQSELQLFEFLSKIKLFERLSEEQLAEFQPFLYERTYNQKEVVFFTNDPSHALYIVKDGTVSLNLNVNDRFEELAVLSKGSTFGDNSLIEGTKRIYSSIVISEKADLFVIPQTNILEIMDDDVEIRGKIMTSFAEMYDAYTSNIFKNYRSNFGFFELGQVYRNMTDNNH